MNTQLERSAPLAEGVDPGFILNFLNACEKSSAEIHGIMIARHGKVIFEAYNAPYEAQIPHIMHSFTKILTNTAAALAYADGLLNLDDPVLKYFPEYEESANEYLKACRVRNLITMRSGQERSIGGNEWRPLKSSWKEAYFKVPFVCVPGEHYLYSSGNSYILSCIVQKLEGKTCRELVWERVGKEIGLEEFSWMESPEGVCSGGNGVSLRVEDMLRIGLLYLNRGNWQGRQLIPASWVEEALGYANPIPPVEGVQYNFHWEHRKDIWAACGLFGQTCGLIPDLDMVFAVTAADEKFKSLELFQKEIVDPMKAGQRDMEAEEILIQKGLRMTLEGKNRSVASHIIPEAQDFFWKLDGKIDSIIGIELHFEEDRVIYKMEDDRGSHQVTAGLDHWIHGTTTMTGAYLHHQYEPTISRISAMAYWSDDRTLTMEWRFPEMAFFDHLQLRWKDDAVIVDRWVNMNSQDRKRPSLILKNE